MSNSYNYRMRNIEEGEFYHVFNRGVRKQPLFHDIRDYSRFLFLILHSHGMFIPTNIGRNVTYYIRDSNFGLDEADIQLIKETRAVDLVSFCLMPNHVHLLLSEVKEGGISKFMQRVLNAYTKYYNERYKESGHAFQGKFKSVHVTSNKQLLHLSAYIHCNTRELVPWRSKIIEYPYSSLQDYTSENRWPALINQSVILEQFGDRDEYRRFIETSPAKLKDFDVDFF